jgi:hypothetical protein
MVIERVVKCDGCLEDLDEFGAHWALDIYADPADEDEDDTPIDEDSEYMHLFHGARCWMAWFGRCFADALEEGLRDG